MKNTWNQNIEPTFVRRAFFWWCCLWASLMTVISAVGSIIHQWFSRDIGVFRSWSLFWGKSMLYGMGIKVRAHMRADLKCDAAFVFVANHQVALDIPAAGLAIPCPFGWVAKAELAKTPVLGQAIKASPSVFIDRSQPKKSLESIRIAGQKIREGLSVIIFPEGYRTYGARVQPFKKGAFLLAVEAGVPIVPVTILNAYSVFDEQRKVARPGTIHIVVGKPISQEALTRHDTARLMDQVHGVINEEIEDWNRSYNLP